MKRIYSFFFAALLLLAASCSPQEHVLHIVTTGDVHGSWFDEPYVEGQATKTSLMSVNAWVDSLRQAVGRDNVLLLDAGDCLQGDNAPYYYNYVEDLEEHLFPDLVSYMEYDAVTVGNHDIETGHRVYDRIAEELAERHIPFLGGNALRTDNGEPYFPVYKMFRRGGMKVAVLGFTNPNMKAWLAEPVWSGIEFVSLIPCVQEWVDRVRAKEKPDVVVVLVHSGTGNGDGSVLESQGLDLLNSLQGVDVLVTSHDHRPFVREKDGTWLINGGARAGHVGHAVVQAQKQDGSLVKQVRGEYVRMDKNKVDEAMKEHFRPAFEEIKAFTLQPVGELAVELRTRDAYTGMSDYVNLVHTVQLGAPEVQVSFAAPLTYNGTVKSGQVIYNDMFTIYPYENQLYVVKLKGSEIKDYLEYSYDNWIQTPGRHILKIRNSPDARTGAEHWSFVNRSYNFDSAAGLVYTVDVTRPAGSRVQIRSLADGSAFDPEGWYNVAMTSYRASGGGDIIPEGAGLDSDQMEERIVERLPEIREMIYQYIKKHGTIDAALINDPAVLGEWHFVPEKLTGPMLDADMALIFGKP
ncbi:MAG: 5'-nucleotidase C-terminal domain-containing protein [Bacteroidales bacterium]|nr:5'-nucleotidase C-terminal domain-containing protein [Bacteroidales bacterium]